MGGGTDDGLAKAALAAGVGDDVGVAELIHPATVAAAMTSATTIRPWLAPHTPCEDFDTSVTSV